MTKGADADEAAKVQAMATDRPTNRANIPLPLLSLPLPLLLQAIIKKVIQ